MSVMPDLTGQMLDRYEIRARIGAGGMGAVYRAYQASLQREVAVKVLPPELAAESGYLARFEREAAVSASLEHKHIVPLIEYGTHDDITYVVMRLLTGGSLADRVVTRVDAGQPLPSMLEIAELLRDIASALDYAHSQGVIHRDIKPTNVMFDNQGDPYLVDFGIAKLLFSSKVLTAAGTTMGTPAYMAPEQWRAEEPSAATDQYAVGVMVYELATGEVPFQAPTPYGLMHLHLNEPPPPPRTHNPLVPEAITPVLNRALAKEPLSRFETVTAFAQSFEQAIAGIAATPTHFFTFSLPDKPESRVPVTPGRFHQTRPPVYRTWRFWGVAALLVVMIAVVAFLVFSAGSDGDGDGVVATERATESVQAVAVEISDTPGPTSTATLLPSETATEPPMGTESPPATATGTLPPTAAPTEHILAPEDSAATLVAAQASETAQSWTDTPAPTPTMTPNLTATVEALVAAMAASTATQQARDLTATATLWTPTPTGTPTLSVTPTHTPTATNTATPTLSHTPTATQTAPPTPPLDLEPVTRNADWTPIVGEFDGVEMVLVPSGCFMMGSEDGVSDERPVHEQCIEEPFWIDRTEVTRAMYAVCNAAGHCTETPASIRSSRDTQPINHVTWFQARDYCEWRGARLPTEVEWEYAARGPDSLVYPWGDEFLADNAVSGNARETADVGSKSGGVSWVGGYDLSGNVSEWVNTTYQSYPYDADDGRESNNDTINRRVFRGGSYDDNDFALRAAFRGNINPDYADGGFGFRCARSYE